MSETYKWLNRGTHVCGQLCKGGGPDVARWTCVNVLMHLQILIRHSYEKRGIIYC